MDDCLPAPTPGQPRKTSRINSPARQARAKSASFGIVEDAAELEEQPEKEVVEMHTHRRSKGQHEGESEEEWALKRLSRRTSSKSPNATSGSAEKVKRAVSYTTTTTTTTYNYGGLDAEQTEAEAIMSDVENWGVSVDAPTGGTGIGGEENIKPRAKAPAAGSVGAAKSGSGSGMIGVVKTRTPGRRSPESREMKSGIRKTSGRVGSAGARLK